MKITKFSHSCLLVESAEPTIRTALFDPGVFSTFTPASFAVLNDIFITHVHSDHMDVARIKQLQMRFPNVQITAPPDAAVVLTEAGITGVRTNIPQGIILFKAPHEAVRPYSDTEPPQEYAYHYLEALSHPGDSHSFHETMPILALPVTAPWGSTVQAMQIALKLHPKYIIPIHDWHWRDEARMQMYDRLQVRFAEEGITFINIHDNIAVTIDI